MLPILSKVVSKKIILTFITVFVTLGIQIMKALNPIFRFLIQNVNVYALTVSVCLSVHMSISPSHMVHLITPSLV